MNTTTPVREVPPAPTSAPTSGATAPGEVDRRIRELIARLEALGIAQLEDQQRT
jgi:hypothetical protein